MTTEIQSICQTVNLRGPDEAVVARVCNTYGDDVVLYVLNRMKVETPVSFRGKYESRLKQFNRYIGQEIKHATVTKAFDNSKAVWERDVQKFGAKSHELKETIAVAYTSGKILEMKPRSAPHATKEDLRRWGLMAADWLPGFIEPAAEEPVIFDV